MGRKIFGLLFVFLFSVSLYAIEGTYSVSGFDPYEKKPYTGTVEITKGQNGIYQAHWTLNLDPPEYTGTGLMHKDQISFVYQSSAPREGGEVGLQVYTIKKGKLEGNFVYYNGTMVGTETLTKR